MAALSLIALARLMEGKLMQGRPEEIINSYAFDTRDISPGALFFALKGARDGHEFISEALKKGAKGACVSREVRGLPSEFGLILVDDTLKAMQLLAARILKNHSTKVVGITGSLGKTSTKEFAARILSTRFNVLKSPGNYNNQIGLPISILSLNESSEIAVLEMGMSQAGEIRRLTEIAPPDVAVITGIAPVHLEFFKSLEDIAQAKKEILDGARPGATAILNGDDPLLRKIGETYSKGPIIYFGSEENCRIRAVDIKFQGLNGTYFRLIYDQEEAEIKVPFFNESLVYNFLAACAVAFSFDLKLKEIQPAFSDLPTIEHRGQLLKLKDEIFIYDDSYNSNPVALNRVLESLGQIKAARKIAVLGDMLELGPQESYFHREAGKKVVQTGWDLIITVGLRAREIAAGALDNGLSKAKIWSFLQTDEAADFIISLIQPGDFVLIKGSHALTLSRIVEFLKKELEA
ncbi:MAG: UDP-N-acetylmuramoyl-tripeptide--D-alanyl-D-alanine ligase [Candidatus Aminicenantes bacterium]|jgi:UDP-N-acetylmuramoyl-tripeptide--D-alanyl-D-alanine ligase|nr:UDP-N-acetylmuramoyl-tripeptide--D-alanyl-D-alanine ligase [Candidatus Aminicenantes bacterium]